MPVDPVGAYLREMRERRGISLDEISRQTRVPARYLEALEKDCLADLPAPVFVRGYIRAYCQVLGEAPEHALARHDALAGTLPPPVRPAPPAANGRARARSLRGAGSFFACWRPPPHRAITDRAIPCRSGPGPR